MTMLRNRGREVGLGADAYAEKAGAGEPPGSKGVGAPEAMHGRLLQS
jgi:hypothetical protein